MPNLDEVMKARGVKPLPTYGATSDTGTKSLDAVMKARGVQPINQGSEPRSSLPSTDTGKPDFLHSAWAGLKTLLPGEMALNREGKSVGGFLGNAVSSAGNLVKGVATAVAHPIQTGETLLRGAAGGVEYGLEKATGKQPGELFTKDNQNKQTASAIADFFKNRYGSMKAINDTAYNDPAGFMADLSVVLGGVGGVASKAGEVGEIGSLAKTGAALSKAGEAINPLTKLSEVAKPVASGITKMAGRTAEEVLGATTGAGYGSVREALRNPSPELYQAMRGGTAPEQIAQEARDAFGQIAQNRSKAYQNELTKITGNKETFDISGLKEQAKAGLKDFGVKEIIKEDGTKGLDFSRSKIADTAEQKRMEEIASQVADWGSQKGDRTAVGLDTLKQRLDDFYSPSSSVRKYVTTLRKSVNDLLKAQVPGYEKMVGDYKVASDLMKEMNGLSIGKNASNDTIMRKLSSVMRQNNETRLKLVNDLKAVSGNDFTAKIAGAQLNSIMPRGLMKVVAGAGAAFEGVRVVMSNPAMLLAIATTSPRIVGELLGATGLTVAQIKKILPYLPEIKSKLLPLYEAGRTSSGQ